MMSSRIYKAVNMSDNLILKDIAIFLADYASLLLAHIAASFSPFVK